MSYVSKFMYKNNIKKRKVFQGVSPPQPFLNNLILIFVKVKKKVLNK